MKKYVFFLVLFLGLSATQSVFAQVDDKRIKNISDSIAGLYQRYFRIEESSDFVQKKVSNINNLEDKLKVLENQTQGNSERLNQLTDEDRRTEENIYDLNKKSVIATANFMDAINTGLNALEFSVSSLDYANSIFELNNPTNSDLGFSLDKSVLKIVDEKIIQGKAGKKFGDKLRGIISGIINNPIVNPIINNPITKAIVSTVPAVSSISSVFNVVNSLAVTEDIGQEALKSFGKELQKYVAHYEALAKASRDLDFNLANLKVKTESMRKLVTNFAKQSVMDLYTEQASPQMDVLDLNTIVRKYYNYASVVEYVQQLEIDYKRNYKILSKRLIYPLVGRSKVAFIGEEIEKLYNEYLATLSSYHDNVVIILNNATSLSDDPNKVKNKIYDLDARYKNLLVNYEKNVDLRNIKILQEKIPRF